MDTRTDDATPAETAVPTDATPQRPGATRTARFGLLVMAFGPVLAAVGDLGVLVYAAPMIVLPAIGAFLVTRYGRWAHAVAAVLGVLGVAVAVPGTWVYTEVPDSFFDVVPTTMFLVGGVLAAVGGVAGAVARWRAAALGPVRAGGVAVIGIIGVGSAVLGFATSSDVDEGALAAATGVRVDDRGYDPEELPLPPGGTVTLAIHNDGRIAHSFTSDALGVDVMLSPGEVVLAEVTVPVDVAGLQYWCVPHSQVAEDGRREWMVGELVAAG